MKVKQIKQRGELVWLVDGTINGKRKRMFFATERQPERWLKAEEEDTTLSKLVAQPLKRRSGGHDERLHAIPRRGIYSALGG